MHVPRSKVPKFQNLDVGRNLSVKFFALLGLTEFKILKMEPYDASTL